MTDLNITEVPTRISYLVGNTAQTQFSVNFPFFQTKDLDVYVDGVIKNEVTDYTVTTIAAEDGGFLSGTVTFNVGQSDCTVAIVRNITKERTTDFPPSGGFNIRELNRQLDQLTAVSQDLQRKIDQKIGFQETDFDDDLVNVVDTAANRANKYIGFDNTGKSIVVKEGSTTGTAQTLDDTKVPKTTKVIAGRGLKGGGQLTSDVNISLIDVFEETPALGASPEGDYFNANISVDSKGRVTKAETGAGGSGGGLIVKTSLAGGLTGGHELGQSAAELDLMIRDQELEPDVYNNPRSISVNKKGIITSILDGGSVQDAKVNVSVTGDTANGLMGGGPLSTVGGVKIQMPVLLPTATTTPSGTHSESTVFNNASIKVDRFGKITQVSPGTVPGLSWTDMSQTIDINGTPHAVDKTGQQDSALPLQAHIDALAATGGVLYFPTGTYACSNALNITGKPVVIMGDGIDVTRIKFTGANGGFNITLTGDSSDNQPTVTDGYEATVKDMTIHTTVAGGTSNVALKFTNDFTAGVNDPSVVCTNLHITGGLPSAYWYTCIHLIDCPQVKMSHLFISGEVNTINNVATTNLTRTGTERGIYITTTNSATEYHLDNSNIFFCVNGILIDGDGGTNKKDSEGYYITSCGMVACKYGIHSDQVNTALGLQLINSHLSCQISNVVGFFTQAFINNNLLYNRPESPDNNANLHFASNGFLGLQDAAGNTANMQSFIITNNIFVNVAQLQSAGNPDGTQIDALGIIMGDAPTPAQNGVIPDIEKMYGVNISYNHFQWNGSERCVEIRHPVQDHTLAHNSFYFSPGAQFTNSTNTPDVYANFSPRNPRCTTGRRVVFYRSQANANDSASLYNTHTGTITGNTVNNNAGFVIPKMTTIYDTDAFGTFDSNGFPRITIPSNNSIKWVKVGAEGVMNRINLAGSEASQFPGPCYLIIQHFRANGAHVPTAQNYNLSTSASPQGPLTQYIAGAAGNSQLEQPTGMHAEAYLVKVENGDYFTCSFSHSSGSNSPGQTVEEGAQFWLEVVEGL